MEYFKKLNQISIVFMITILCSCKSHNKPSSQLDFHKNEYSFVDNTYCFEKIKDSIKEIELFDISNDCKYYKLDKKNIFSNKRIIDFNYVNEIESFIEFNSYVSFYLLKRQNHEILILIGQAAGATGIGVDYNAFECYPMTSEDNVLKFLSLSKSPFSVYINHENELCYVEISDNYLRPADGQEVDLGFYPLIVSIFKDKKEVKTIEYNCY
jgi:hypothetical protein